MSFVQDMVIRNVSSVHMRNQIVALSARLGIEENKSMFILLLYDWNEDQIIADLNHLSMRLRSVLTEHDLQSTPLGHCSMCQNQRECKILDCNHLVCLPCLTAYIVALLERGNTLLVCPAQGCNKFLNPCAFNGLHSGVRTRFTKVLLRDFMAKVPNPYFLHLKRVLKLVTAGGALVTAGVTAFGTHKVLDYRQKHPQTWKSLTIIGKKIARGDNPISLTFWVKARLESEFGIGR